jgi:hypothetical protein
MRSLVVAVACVVALWGSPVAAAEPVMFTDNPAIVDPHPLPFDSWKRVDGDHAVAVQFMTGTPECYGVHATVEETAETVTIALTGGTLPEAVGRACIMIALSGTLEVPLQGPLGDRQVLDKHQ